MSKYANGTPFTRAYDKFEYHLEDTDCEFCLYRHRKSKSRNSVCGLEACCCGDIRAEAVACGRIKRKRGWNGL